MALNCCLRYYRLRRWQRDAWLRAARRQPTRAYAHLEHTGCYVTRRRALQMRNYQQRRLPGLRPGYGIRYRFHDAVTVNSCQWHRKTWLHLHTGR